jgi:hypothetical protein
MSAKHTPGPWVRDRRSGIGCDVRAANGRKVALCWGLSTSKAALNNTPAYRAECDANARLIAAAPCMLAAMRELVAYVVRDGGMTAGESIEVANARFAIEKACRK